MQIIAGQFKGRRIPFNYRKQGNARVTSDFVKKATFTSLGEFLANKSFLDLFSCSGQIGLEAYSRGAQVVMNEPDHRRNRFIAQLLQSWDLSKHIQLHKRPAQALLSQLARSDNLFDVVYLDPPYHENIDDQPISCAILSQIAQTPILKTGAHVLVQHESRTELPQDLPDLLLSRLKKYGDTTLTTYKKE